MNNRNRTDINKALKEGQILWGHRFFKKTGFEIEGQDLWDPITEVELEHLNQSEDILKTLQKNHWRRFSFCEFIDPDISAVICLVNVPYERLQIYKDGEPAFGPARKYIWIWTQVAGWLGADDLMARIKSV